MGSGGHSSVIQQQRGIPVGKKPKQTSAGATFKALVVLI